MKILKTLTAPRINMADVSVREATAEETAQALSKYYGRARAVAIVKKRTGVTVTLKPAPTVVTKTAGGEPMTIEEQEPMSQDLYWEHYGPGPGVPFTKENVEKYSGGEYTTAKIGGKTMVVVKEPIRTAPPEPTAPGKTVITPGRAYEYGMISERERAHAETTGQYIETTMKDIETSKTVKTRLEKEFPGAEISPGATPYGKYKRMVEQREKTIGTIADAPVVRMAYVFHGDILGIGTISEFAVAGLTGTKWDEGRALRMEYARTLYERRDVVIGATPGKVEYLHPTAGVGFRQPPQIMKGPTEGAVVPSEVSAGVIAGTRTGAVAGSFALAGGVAGPTMRAVSQTGINVIYGVGMGQQIARTIKEPSAEEIARTFVYSTPLMLHAGARAFPTVKKTAVTVGHEIKMKGKMISLGIEKRLPGTPQATRRTITTIGKEGRTARASRPETVTLYEDRTLGVYRKTQKFAVEISEPDVFVRSKISQFLRRPPKRIHTGRRFELVGVKTQELYWHKVTGKARLVDRSLAMTRKTETTDIRFPKPAVHDIYVQKFTKDLKGPKITAESPKKPPGGPSPPPGGPPSKKITGPLKPTKRIYTAKDILQEKPPPKGAKIVKSGKTALAVKTKTVMRSKEDALVKTRPRQKQISRIQLGIIRTTLMAGKFRIEGKEKARAKERLRTVPVISTALISGRKTGQVQAEAIGFGLVEKRKARQILGAPLQQLTGQPLARKQKPRADLIGGFGYTVILPPGALEIGGGGGSGALIIGRKLRGKKPKYKASLGGILSGETIKKAPKRILTGLEHRYPVKRKKIKRGLI